MTERTLEEIDDEVRAFVDDAWDPDLTVAEWWQRLYDAGWSHPLLPEKAGGRGWSRSAALRVRTALAECQVLLPPSGLGAMLAAPTIAAHGTQEQIDRYVTAILTGRDAWCQLFSEPGAGSDLAGLQTRAVRDGDEWVVNGQKVWTSQGSIADLGMLVARTDPDQPKHRGLTYFAFPMLQDGVDVRPLREMTGEAFFNEVFVNDGRVHDDARIGDLGDGWRVANTTLTEERASIGAGTALVAARPGSVCGDLGRRAGDFVTAASTRTAAGDDPGRTATAPKGRIALLVDLARRYDRLGDQVLRDRLMRAHTLNEVNRLNTLRAKAGRGRTGAEGNIAKLLDSELHRQARELGTSILGADATLATTDRAGSLVRDITLFSPAPSIYGGTDQIQRNIIGERVLGLPKEPGPGKDTPFKDLPHNQ
jgi:alkylation response protein AidB-like acyl-CoA dehydrogenase